jgi:hypothetical protein
MMTASSSAVVFAIRERPFCHAASEITSARPVRKSLSELTAVWPPHFANPRNARLAVQHPKVIE